MIDTFTGKLGPREIALAAAFGVLVGLIPKANLTVVLLGILFFFSHANILIGLVVMLIVSLLAPWAHPMAANLGGEILTSPPGMAITSAVFPFPLVPWTSLNNTVVAGSFLIGLVLFLPIFLVVWIPLKILWPKKAKEEEKPEKVTNDE